MKREKTVVCYWKYDDGWSVIPDMLRDASGKDQEFEECLVGWHCWVYPKDDYAFEEWMDKNMLGKFECIHRFNSGDPMYTVQICNDEDATLFKLTWM